MLEESKASEIDQNACRSSKSIIPSHQDRIAANSERLNHESPFSACNILRGGALGGEEASPFQTGKPNRRKCITNIHRSLRRFLLLMVPLALGKISYCTAIDLPKTSNAQFLGSAFGFGLDSIDVDGFRVVGRVGKSALSQKDAVQQLARRAQQVAQIQAVDNNSYHVSPLDCYPAVMAQRSVTTWWRTTSWTTYICLSACLDAQDQSCASTAALALRPASDNQTDGFIAMLELHCSFQVLPQSSSSETQGVIDVSSDGRLGNSSIKLCANAPPSISSSTGLNRSSSAAPSPLTDRLASAMGISSSQVKVEVWNTWDPVDPNSSIVAGNDLWAGWQVLPYTLTNCDQKNQCSLVMGGEYPQNASIMNSPDLKNLWLIAQLEDGHTDAVYVSASINGSQQLPLAAAFYSTVLYSAEFTNVDGACSSTTASLTNNGVKIDQALPADKQSICAWLQPSLQINLSSIDECNAVVTDNTTGAYPVCNAAIAGNIGNINGVGCVTGCHDSVCLFVLNTFGVPTDASCNSSYMTTARNMVYRMGQTIGTAKTALSGTANNNLAADPSKIVTKNRTLAPLANYATFDISPTLNTTMDIAAARLDVLQNDPSYVQVILAFATYVGAAAGIAVSWGLGYTHAVVRCVARICGPRSSPTPSNAQLVREAFFVGFAHVLATGAPIAAAIAVLWIAVRAPENYDGLVGVPYSTEVQRESPLNGSQLRTAGLSIQATVYTMQEMIPDTPGPIGLTVVACVAVCLAVWVSVRAYWRDVLVRGYRMESHENGNGWPGSSSSSSQNKGAIWSCWKKKKMKTMEERENVEEQTKGREVSVPSPNWIQSLLWPLGIRAEECSFSSSTAGRSIDSSMSIKSSGLSKVSEAKVEEVEEGKGRADEGMGQ